MLRRHLTALLLVTCAVIAATSAMSAPDRAASGDSDPRLERPLSLDDCVQIALENNIDLRIARLGSEAARAGIGAEFGAFWPEFTLSVNRSDRVVFGETPEGVQLLRNGTFGMVQKLPVGSTIGVDWVVQHDRLRPDPHDTPSQNIVLSFVQPLLRGAGWRTNMSGVATSRYAARISDASTRSRELAVTVQTKTAYYEVIRNYKLIDVNERAVGRDSQLVRQSQGKLDTGLGTKRDVLSAEIQLEQDRGSLVDAVTAYQEALDTLARVLGLQIGVRTLEIADHDVTLDSIRIDESRWIEKARRDNPALTSARLSVERSQVSKDVAHNARLPQVDVTASWDRFNDPDLNEAKKEENFFRAIAGDSIKTLKHTGTRGWTAGVVLSYPLGNRTLGNNYRRAQLNLEQTERAADNAERQVVFQVRSAVRALRNSTERLLILQKNIAGARDKLEFASVNFQLGRASNLDITDAQKDLLDAETGYVNEVIDYRIQVATIEQLIGGFE